MVLSLAHMATSSMYLLPDIQPLLDSINFGTLKAELKYYKQAIPSPFGMALYHDISQVTPKMFLEDHGLGRHEGVDITGEAVEQLAKNISIASKIYNFHRLFEIDRTKKFHYQRDKALTNMQQLGVFEK